MNNSCFVNRASCFVSSASQPSLATRMREAQKEFSQSEWELAKMLMRSLGLPWSAAYHKHELDVLKPAFDQYVKALEGRLNQEIADEMASEGYKDAQTPAYRKEFLKRLALSKSKDDRFNALSRLMDEHHSGMQGASRMFLTYMRAWTNHLNMSGSAFVAKCVDVLARLRLCVAVELPGNFAPSQFMELCRFMKQLVVRAS